MDSDCIRRSLGHSSTSYRRPEGLGTWLLAVALGIGVSVGHGQWLETKITLPDSLGGAVYPFCLTTDTSERYVYVGDYGYEHHGAGGGVYVVDAESRTRVAKIPFGFISAVCTNTRRNKVYAADYIGNRVLAISCATNQVVATIPAGVRPTALCYNSVDDKLYAANADGNDLTVVDCSSDNVIKTIRFGESPTGLGYNPASNRVFCVMNDTLVVIDGASDSVTATYAATWWSGLLVVNAVANRVYSAGVIDGDRGLFVLDGTSGAVLDTLPDWPDAMCLNPHTQKLYTCNVSTLSFRVWDCATDTLIRRSDFRVGMFDIYSMVCDAATGKVYAACVINQEDVIVVMSGVTDTIAAMVPGPSGARLLASARRECVYGTDGYGPGLVVYDTRSDSLLGAINIGGSTGKMCYDSIDDKLYYRMYSRVHGAVGVIDAATNRSLGDIQVGARPADIVWHAPTNRVYCGGSNITVIDPTVDTVTRVLPVPAYDALCSAPRVNKVYFEIDSVIGVIDCRNDSVIKMIPVPIEPMWPLCYVSTASHDKLYVGGWGGVAIIDCIGDTLIRSHPFSWTRLVAGRDGKRVHCLRPYWLCIFDTEGDTLVAEVSSPASWCFDLLYIPGADKVYAADPSADQIVVADGETDSLIAQIPLRMPTSLCYDSTSKLVYVGSGLGGDSIVRFIDSRTDRIVDSLDSRACPGGFAMVPQHHRVFVGPISGTSVSSSSMPVIRTDPPGVAEGTLHALQKRIPGPTILPRNSRLVVLRPSVLLDAAGRKVCDVDTGSHELGCCRAGVYFLRTATGVAVKKLLLVD